MNTIDMSLICTVSGFSLLLYNEVQRVTGGKAYKSAHLLAALTACELDDCRCPDACFCLLALLSLADLADQAPGFSLEIANWTDTWHRIRSFCGEASIRELERVLCWAQLRWPDVIKTQLQMPGLLSRQTLNDRYRASTLAGDNLQYRWHTQG